MNHLDAAATDQTNLDLEEEVVTFSHTPVRPVRTDVLGEVVFMRHWHELMQREDPSFMHDWTPNYSLQCVLDSLATQLTERHATVAASIIKWLGTNGGRSFIQQVQDKLDQRKDEPASIIWLQEWTKHNLRVRWRNSNTRTLEAILVTEQDVYPDGDINPPALTAMDMETAECLMFWLGTAEGAGFIAACNREIVMCLDLKRVKAPSSRPALRLKNAEWQTHANEHGESLYMGAIELGSWSVPEDTALSSENPCAAQVMTPGKSLCAGKHPDAASARKAVEEMAKVWLDQLSFSDPITRKQTP